MSARGDEFYIGWEPRAPRSLARRTRLTVLALFILAAALAVGLVRSQSPFDFGVFEFGNPRTFRGTVVAEPYPHLVLDAPARPAPDAPEVGAYDLVASGKRGAGALVEGWNGRRVELSGTLIYNRARAMIEVVEGSIEDDRLDTGEGTGAGADPPHAERIGRRKLVGEIVDSKCYLGVMKPGRSKPHKACAIRCISGGIPPVLRVEDRAGAVAYFLLTDAAGAAVNDRVLDRVAEPVEIEGEVYRVGDRWILRADPAGYRRPGVRAVDAASPG